jgi:YVTN family beta-propeller protein
MRRLPLLLPVAFLLVVLTAVPTLVNAQQATPVATPLASPLASPIAGSPVAGTDCLVGQQGDGSVVLPTNQIISPAGQQVEFLGRANVVALRPDGQTAAILTAEDPEPITVIDLASGQVRQEFTPDANPDDEEEVGASFAGLLYAPDGNRLYAADGTLTLVERVVLPADADATARPGGMALSEDGNTLYVALNAKNTVGVFDLASRTLTAEIPVGNAPHGVVRVGTKLYVSNEGGRPAQPGDFTNDSGGTEIVADPRTGAAITGTVSVVDLAAGAEATTISVGLHPTALMAHQGLLFVANTNSDTLSVVDTATDEVVKSIAVQAFPGAPWGSSPNALTMVGEDRLVVSLGRNNALAVYEWEGPAQPVGFQGLIPTGWYPASVAVDVPGDRLVVANAKGVGSLGPELETGPYEDGANPVGHYVHSNLGSASLIPLAALAEAAMEGHTATVYRNNQWSTSRCATLERGAAGGDAAVAPVAVPVQVGDPSKIKHVFYIIKENRTYDQVLGDMPQGNGDPSLVQFGREVTPNQHALAEQFQLMDNLYVSGSLSADGHQWVTQAYVSDYIERSFGDFSRSYPFNGGDALAYAPTGFLWDNALRNGKGVRAYGEYANGFTGQADPFGDDFGAWTDWYRDARILAGEESGNLSFPRGLYQTRTDVPSLDALLNRDFPPYSMQIPDQYRAEIFLEEFAAFEQSGDLPNLVMMLLPANHTAGTTPGMPTPRAMVADNDLALGRIVEAITKSRFWPESAIFVVEDDAQNGVDHVDGHRTTGWVISPYAKRGIVDSTYYTQIDMVRTIEQILGLPPMNQMDLAATPMRDLFTETPDLTPFTALPNRIPLDELNPPESALSGVELAWAETSAAMGFDAYADIATGPDAKDENVLNRAIWYGSKGFETPYPGDPRVLWPHEVPAAAEDEEEELEELEEAELGG